jgi:putative PIN family toxin of toxin-antitoxin system
LSAALIKQWAELIEMRALVVAAPPIDISQSRDPKDAMFRAAALASDADFLITGDSDLLQAKSAIATRIVTVAEFAAEFRIH